jgi:uncharacterized protein (TIGR03435 family)
MMIVRRAIEGMPFLVLLSSAVLGQSAGAPPSGNPPAFQIADVHSSPRSNTPFMRGGDLHGDSYIVRQATMVDLIANAYGMEREAVLSGPAWLDIDRFEISAKAPRTTSPEDVKLMLRDLLADRFKLVVHNDVKDLPAFVLSVGKGGSKLKESDGSGESGCGPNPAAPPPAPGPTSYIWVSCHNMTSADIARNLHQMAGGYLTNPVADLTGLKGSYDFNIKWTGRGALAAAGADGISIFDAVDKQLGLKLEAKSAPLPVLVVDSVNEKPTPNAPGIDKALPPQPPAAFAVGVIKPSPPDAKGLSLQVRGGQITVTNATIQFLITWAWGLNPNDKEALVGAPKWLDQDHYDILGKMAANSAPAAKGAPPVDFDDLQQMVRTFVTERFELKSHMEDHLADAYTLVAASPKLKKGDPTMRTGCKEGPGPDGKDPRIANPILGRLITCQNMTMTELGDELRTLAGGYIYYPVLDSTGLEGGYDFTLSFSPIQSLNAPKPAPTGGDSSAASDPSGAISLFDAINKQLGLKLEKQRRPEPALVIDHIDEKPTEN